MQLYRDAIRAGIVGVRRPAIAMSDIDVFRLYRGIDGNAWPISPPTFALEGGLAAPELYPLVKAYLEDIAGKEADLVALRGAPSPKFRLLGFDVGAYESEFSHFSVILNEVLYGTLEELRDKASLLNEHLLCASDSSAFEVLRMHEILLERGADVEEMSAPMEVIAVYGEG
jgi:hypothetical protein